MNIKQLNLRINIEVIDFSSKITLVMYHDELPPPSNTFYARYTGEVILDRLLRKHYPTITSIHATEEEYATNVKRMSMVFRGYPDLHIRDSLTTTVYELFR